MATKIISCMQVFSFLHYLHLFANMYRLSACTPPLSLQLLLDKKSSTFLVSSGIITGTPLPVYENNFSNMKLLLLCKMVTFHRFDYKCIKTIQIYIQSIITLQCVNTSNNNVVIFTLNLFFSFILK